MHEVLGDVLPPREQGAEAEEGRIVLLERRLQGVVSCTLFPARRVITCPIEHAVGQEGCTAVEIPQIRPWLFCRERLVTPSWRSWCGRASRVRCVATEPHPNEKPPA